MLSSTFLQNIGYFKKNIAWKLPNSWSEAYNYEYMSIGTIIMRIYITCLKSCKIIGPFSILSCFHDLTWGITTYQDGCCSRSVLFGRLVPLRNVSVAFVIRRGEALILLCLNPPPPPPKTKRVFLEPKSNLSKEGLRRISERLMYKPMTFSMRSRMFLFA